VTGLANETKVGNESLHFLFLSSKQFPLISLWSNCINDGDQNKKEHCLHCLNLAPSAELAHDHSCSKNQKVCIQSWQLLLSRHSGWWAGQNTNQSFRCTFRLGKQDCDLHVPCKKTNIYFASCWTRHFSPAGSLDACTPTGPGEVATPAATWEWQC